MTQTPSRSGLVPIVGEVRDDGRVTLFRPLPRPSETPADAAPAARPALRLVRPD